MKQHHDFEQTCAPRPRIKWNQTMRRAALSQCIHCCRECTTDQTPNKVQQFLTILLGRSFNRFYKSEQSFQKHRMHVGSLLTMHDHESFKGKNMSSTIRSYYQYRRHPKKDETRFQFSNSCYIKRNNSWRNEREQRTLSVSMKLRFYASHRSKPPVPFRTQ